MIIDTNEVLGWIKLHSRICLPIATAVLSWYAAMRWQVAITHSELALEIYYFFVCASSGITTIALIIKHFIKLGFFDD